MMHTAVSRPFQSEESARARQSDPRVREDGCAFTHGAGEQTAAVLTISSRREIPSVDGVPRYLVETYLARHRAAERADRDERARSAADALTRGMTRVRFERSIYVPEDETSLYVFDAPSSEIAALAAERADLEPIRIVEAVT
jgi:hypothetical protein